MVVEADFSVKLEPQAEQKFTSFNPPAKYINHFTHVLNRNSVDKLSLNVKFETVKPTN